MGGTNTPGKISASQLHVLFKAWLREMLLAAEGLQSAPWTPSLERIFNVAALARAVGLRAYRLPWLLEE